MTWQSIPSSHDTPHTSKIQERMIGPLQSEISNLVLLLQGCSCQDILLLYSRIAFMSKVDASMADIVHV